MTCPFCGTELSEGANFCGACGNSISAAAPEAPAAPYQDPATFQQYPPQNQYYQQPYGAQMPPMAPVVPGKGLGIASMVLGILSLVLGCFWYIGLPLAIVGAVLGGVASSKAKKAGLKNGMATAGLVCSIISLGFAALAILGLGSLIGIGTAGLF